MGVSEPGVGEKTVDLQSLTAPVEQIDAYMAECLDARELPRNLREAMRYALLGPGKRMRPILTLRSSEAVGGTAEQALAPAAALEMIHAFSLVHDDLPAMDDDDLRRGRPTLHVALRRSHRDPCGRCVAADGVCTPCPIWVTEPKRAVEAIGVLGRAGRTRVSGREDNSMTLAAEGVHESRRRRGAN